MNRAHRSIGSIRSGTAGAVFVEFLIVFIPVLTMFLCLVQLALLFALRIVVAHAAVNAARTAAVVIGDDPKSYGEPAHRLNAGGKRFKAIENAALLTLAPFIIDGTISNVKLEFPAQQSPGGDERRPPLDYQAMQDSTIDKVRVRLVVTAICKIGLADAIACGGLIELVRGLGRPSKVLRAEAVYPYQGARYTYP